MRGVRRACVLIVPAAMALAACGGGGDSGDEGGATDEEFIAKVDAVCAQTAKDVGALQAAEGTPSNISELDAYLDKRIPISERGQGQVEAIEPPPEAVDSYEAYLAERRDFIDLLHEQKRAASGSDDAAAVRLDTETADADPRLAAAAGEVGLRTCAGKPPAEHQDFRDQVDLVCIGGRMDVEDLFAERGEPSSLDEYANLLPDRTRIVGEEIGALREIDPPAELEAGYGNLINAEVNEESAYRTLGSSAEGGRQEAFDRAAGTVRQKEQATTDAADAIGLEACASHLPPAQEVALRETIESIWTEADPAHCTDDYSDSFVEDQLGGIDACERDEKPANEADFVEIANLAGVEGVSADADITIHGGSHDGETSSEHFIYEDGRWKLHLLGTPD